MHAPLMRTQRHLFVHVPSQNVKLILGVYPRLRSALTLKRTSRIGTIIFFALAIFFAYPYRLVGYRSFFRQSMLLLGVPTYSVVYLHWHTIVYICSSGFGLLLIAAFLKNARDVEGARGIAAINCAWLGFLLQASIGLSLQWAPVAAWVTLNSTLLVLFTITMMSLATSLLFLTNYVWARRFGHLLSWCFFLFNLAVLIVMMKYFVLFFTPFPTLMLVMVIASGTSIHYLGKYDSENSTGKKGDHDGRRFSHKLKRFFTSSKILATILTSVLVLDSMALVQLDSHWTSNEDATKDFYCGVTFGGNTTAEAKLLVDRVKNFTNLFVVDSWPVSENEAVLNEICNYVVESGLYVIVYFAFFGKYCWQACWLDTARQRWGKKFLGVYLYDEPGGVQLDDPYIFSGKRVPNNYGEVAESYVRYIRTSRKDLQMLKLRYIKAFTSDYALYWFDYKAGYDVLFAEFGWNYSRQLNVALCRGAATVQNKNWGTIITWKYNSAPYIESGEELYDDVILAYNNGANYILVFNYPHISNSMYGILGEEHLEALRKFWDFANHNPQKSDSLSDRVAYVLPKDYGYGFRGPNDRIWGIWQTDALTSTICTDLGNSIGQYDSKLDIIYDEKVEPSNVLVYDRLVFWNGTVYTTGKNP